MQKNGVVHLVETTHLGIGVVIRLRKVGNELRCMVSAPIGDGIESVRAFSRAEVLNPPGKYPSMDRAVFEQLINYGLDQLQCGSMFPPRNG